MDTSTEPTKRPRLDISTEAKVEYLRSETIEPESSSSIVDKPELAATHSESLAYQNTCYNRNKTLVAKYANRILDDFPTPSERYYDIRLVKSDGKRNYFGEVGDQCIMFHSNRVCVLAIAPSHPVISEDKTIDRIEHTFDGKDDSIDRTQSKPQGKSKKGTQKVQKNSPICALVCSDGSKYIVTGSLTAQLVEFNSKIISNPKLVKERPLSLGYIAILQPNDWKRMEEVRESLPKLN